MQTYRKRKEIVDLELWDDEVIVEEAPDEDVTENDVTENDVLVVSPSRYLFAKDLFNKIYEIVD